MEVSAGISRVGHVALVTEDVERSTWFWRDVIGLEEIDQDGDTIFLRAWGELEHHSLSLSPGSPSRVEHVGWRTQRSEGIQQFADALGDRAADRNWVKEGEEAGQGPAFRFSTPTGHRFELYHEIERTQRAEQQYRSRLKTNSSRAWARGVSPRRVDHINLTTSDPAAMGEWLGEVMGFQTRELIRLNDGTVAAIWLGVSALSHDVAVMTDAGGRTDGFHHLAYYVDDAQDVLRAADILRENGVEIDGGPGRHGITQAIFLYARDPGSGHRLEIFSGGYLVLDSDWEPVEWSEEELPVAMTWWGPDISALPGMNPTTGF